MSRPSKEEHAAEIEHERHNELVSMLNQLVVELRTLTQQMRDINVNLDLIAARLER